MMFNNFENDGYANCTEILFLSEKSSKESVQKTCTTIWFLRHN